MAITISCARASDADATAKLLHSCWEDAYGSFLSAETLSTIASEWHSPNVLRGQITDPRTVFLVAHTDEQALSGIVTVKRSRDEEVLTVLRLGRSLESPAPRHRYGAP